MAGSATPATIFHDGFEAGSISPAWEISTTGDGRVRASFPLVAGFDQERRQIPVKDPVSFTGSLRSTGVVRGAKRFGNVQTVQPCFFGGLPMSRCAH